MDPEETYDKMLGISAGWGITEDGIASDVLRQVELNIISNTTCVDVYKDLNIDIAEDMICTLKVTKPDPIIICVL